jgi:hypothetical protein
MQVKNQWENANLIMLNNKAFIDNAVADFFIPSQIKQKLFLLVVTCVGDCYTVLLLSYRVYQKKGDL